MALLLSSMFVMVASIIGTQGRADFGNKHTRDKNKLLLHKSHAAFTVSARRCGVNCEEL
jgi:hypothetical protein